MHSILFANLVGVFLYPLTYYQFSSQSKKYFLLLNFTTCLLFGMSLYLTHQYTAATISILAGITSLFQIKDSPMHLKLGIAIISIAFVFVLAYPVGLYAWLPVFCYSWNRIAETQSEYVMRVMFLFSPMVWMAIAYHGHNYTLMPVDGLALVLSLHWIIKRTLARSNRPVFFDPDEH